MSQITYDGSMSAVVVQGSPLGDNVEVYVDAQDLVQVSVQNAGEFIRSSFPKASVALIRFSGGDGDDRFANSTSIPSSASGDNGNDLLLGGTGTNEFYGGIGDDRLVGNIAVDKLFGDDGNDVLEANLGDDILFGGFGDDVLLAGDGNDWLYGQEGDDELFGHQGIDYLFGGAGTDLLDGGLGDDWLYGGAHNDDLIGGDGHDKLYGDQGEDLIRGEAGNDLMSGGSGNDFMRGGDGDDWLMGDDGEDKLFGDAGRDWLFGVAGNDRLEGGTGNDLLAGGAGDDALVGDDGDDTIYGQDGNDWIAGVAGNDVISGGRGDDNLVGGLGDDRLAGGEGNDLLYGEDGNDWLAGEAGNDTLEGGIGNNILLGGAGEDYLVVNGGNNILLGEEGDDELVAGPGHDVLVGGAGSDKLLSGAGNDIVIGGADMDEVNGNQGEDLLLGGSTVYDASPYYLGVLSAAWSAPMPYAARVQQIENRSSIAYLQSEETVFDDRVRDILHGAENQDWFFLTGHLGSYVPADHHSHSGEESTLTVIPPGHQHTQIVSNQLPPLEGFDLIDSLDVLLHRQPDESIHSLIPHADNAVLQREHLALFELVRYDHHTHIAVQSGNWSNPATWQDGALPTDGARVLVPLGVEVHVDSMISTRLGTVRVDGTLSFNDTRNTELRADTVVVSGSGAFVMGTEEAPIASGFTARLLITDNGAIDRVKDPFGIRRGLISHGRVSIYGAAVTSYATMPGTIVAGTKSLSLNDAPSGWKIGDTIAIAGTTFGSNQNEVRTISAMFGNIVVLNAPLAYSHLSPAGRFEVHVANLTRNAVIESEANAADRRGHVMFMHNRNVDVHYAGFYRLGRTDKLQTINDSVVQADWTLKAGTGTNQRGRYAVHFHRNGLTKDGNPSSVIGSAVVDSPGWGFVNHSGYVDFTANVAFDVRGAAFATEVGDEIGGFYGNLAIGVTGSGKDINSREFQFQDFGHQGDGFWFQGAGISVVGNISAGNEGHAFVFYTRGLIETTFRATFLSANLSNPAIAGGAATIPVGLVPVTDFRNNIGYSSLVGLRLRYHLEDATHGQDSLYQLSTFWNNQNGVFLDYTQHTILRNITVVEAPNNAYNTGVRQGGLTGHITYDKLAVSGYYVGIELPRFGNNVVSGGTFDNDVDLTLSSAYIYERSILLTGFAIAPQIALIQDLAPLPGRTVETYFVRDTLTLNFGPFQSRQFYYAGYRANAVPFPSARPDIPAQYVGLTNQQLWERFRVALGGYVVPSTATTVPGIADGLVALV